MYLHTCIMKAGNGRQLPLILLQSPSILRAFVAKFHLAMA